jgi:hypothetical protein
VSEPRTIRDARDAIREQEAALERVHMSPAVALAPFSANFYLRKARLALRRPATGGAEAVAPAAT